MGRTSARLDSMTCLQTFGPPIGERADECTSQGCPQPDKLPSTRASAQKQGHHMKAEKNTRLCCFHGTELEQPADLDSPRLP